MDFEKELEKIGKQYQDEGYNVILHPGADQLPAFAAAFGAEILAIRGDEKVLVQVKWDRATLQADPNIPRWAEIIDANPGWKYDLVVLFPDNPMERIARLAGEPSIEQIIQMLDEAERVQQTRALRAGFVLAWAGVEAVMRRMAQRAGLQGKRGSQPLLLVRELYSTGYISPEDFAFLEQTRQLRTTIVHGLAPPVLDQNLVQLTIDLARRMLAECENASSVAS